MRRHNRRCPSEIEEIRQHLGSLKQQLWLEHRQRWWPDFLFHCTDVRNVENILLSGEMLSRTQALASRQLRVDIASQEIIDQTDETWQDYVRLYFRPRTPTQYRNEGFRPVGHQYHQAHCPVPVYLLINALDVLSMVGVLFTDGNVAARSQPTNDIEIFKSIPFERIYHDRWFDHSERDEIVYHRNAEVLVPERLNASAIRFICCRSQAEYETLRNLLQSETLSRWVNKIGVPSRADLFFRRSCFVEQVEMTRASVLFRFNVGEPPGPFKAHAELIETLTGHRSTWSNDQFSVRPGFRLRLNFQHPQDYTIRFWLDDQLAYSGRYQEEQLPL